MYGVVLAAGRGTRMRPLTDRRPKPLLPVGDRSLLERVFDTVAGVVDEFVVVVGYRGDAIRDAIGESYRGYPVHYVEQAEALGTAHASRRPSPSSTRTSSCSTATWSWMHRSPLADADDGRQSRSTEVVVDPPRHTVCFRRLRTARSPGSSKPDDPPTNRIANVGCYAFPPEVFEYIDRTPRANAASTITTTIELLLDDGHPSYRRGALRGDVARRRSSLGAAESQRTSAHRVHGCRRERWGPSRKASTSTAIVIEEGALVRSGAYVEGPALIREGAEVGPNAYVRGVDGGRSDDVRRTRRRGRTRYSWPTRRSGTSRTSVTPCWVAA